MIMMIDVIMIMMIDVIMIIMIDKKFIDDGLVEVID